MAGRYRRWFPCPCCKARVPVRANACPRCGHGPNSWKLIADVLKLEGSREIRYTSSRK